MAYCTNCGAELPENAHFCPECGHKEEPALVATAEVVSARQVAEASVSGAAQSTGKKGLSGCAIAGIAMGCLSLVGVAILVGIFVIVSAVSAPLEETSDIYFGLISDGNFASAYELTSPTFQSETSEEELNQFLTENSILQTVVETKFSSSRIENSNGFGAGELVTASGETIPVEMTFSKDPDLGWQIDAIKFGDG